MGQITLQAVVGTNSGGGFVPDEVEILLEHLRLQ